MKENGIDARDGKVLQVIIETPKGSQNKFAYDEGYKTFRLHKTLPMGTVFPFDFGFIPHTKGGDGDPLDILVIMEEPVYPGCLVPTRLLGILKASQKEKDGTKTRNDRLVGVSECSVLYKDIKKLNDLNKSMVKEIENFFIDYNKHEGKKFKPIRWKGAKSARQVIIDEEQAVNSK
jgi:inorganic pyrophosphatase